MIKFNVTAEDIFSTKSDCYAFLLEENFVFSPELKKIAQLIFPQLEELFTHHKFTGQLFTSMRVPTTLDGRIVNFLFIGMGKLNKKKKIGVEIYRQLLGKIVNLMDAFEAESVAFRMPSPDLFDGSLEYLVQEPIEISVEYLAKQTAIIINMAVYRFTEFFSKPSVIKKKNVNLAQVTLVIDEKDKKEVERGLELGQLIAQAVNETRHLVDEPSTHKTPIYMAEKAREVAKKYNLGLTVFNKEQILAMGMGGIIGVSQGSANEPTFVILEYKTTKKDAPTIALVGKGITFDSGGLNTKKKSDMCHQKKDMAGAAAVMKTMQVLSVLKPDVNVIGVMPFAENMPDGKAMKDGDILRFYNGMTTEILNTDAEGRLILADALAYTVKNYKPDAIFNIATLTGSSPAFFGPIISPVMFRGNHLANQVKDAANKAGERICLMHLAGEYQNAVRSKIADLQNSENKKYRAGGITAAWFIYSFVGNIPFAHMDIAGTAANVPDISYCYEHIATGAGVRLMIELIMNWKVKK
ncbi:MAG: leucyl aminopeptidase family protein [Candidatus Dependentiae bacterium]|nr:leucyl aminopeptidase family protein [Candidatus Dependentiae bacterium]